MAMQRFEHQENVSPRSVEEMTSDSQQNPFLVKCPVVRARSAPNFKERPRLMIAFQVKYFVRCSFILQFRLPLFLFFSGSTRLTTPSLLNRLKTAYWMPTCTFSYAILYLDIQTKRIGAAVAYKRIQGGVQPDVSVRITSNFIWEMLSLELRPYGCTENIKRLPFHVEEEYGSKVWTRRCESCLVQPWQHKQYTTVRIQFCKGYYGMRLQFIARVGKHTACTKIPIVVVKAGNFSFLPSTLKVAICQTRQFCTMQSITRHNSSLPPEDCHLQTNFINSATYDSNMFNVCRNLQDTIITKRAIRASNARKTPAWG